MFDPDKETLQDVCRDIALENYGFLYVNDDKEEIRSRYDSRGGDEGLAGKVKSAIGGDSIGMEELQSSLGEIANDDFNEFQQIRRGVYFYDPFNDRQDQEVTNTLTQLFKYEIVVPEREMKSRFNLAKKDVDFFTQRLEEEDYVERITTSDHGDYFTIGSQLKDESGDASVDARLRKKAKQGLIAHADLEAVIDAAATDDVIRYLEHEDFIVELEGKYLVRSGVEEFAVHVAREIGDHVEETFDDSAHVLPTQEFATVVENEVDAEFDVLEHLNAGDRDWVLEHVREAVVDQLGLDDDPRDVVVQREAFDDYVDRRATEILETVDDGTLGTPSDFRDEGHPRIEELRMSDSEAADRFIHEQIQVAFDEQVDAMFEVSDPDEEED